jgi:hypothetical protein
MSLIDKIRKARETVVTVGGHNYTVRRPTDMDMAEIAGQGGVPIKEYLRRFVVGWDIKELDLIPGGGPEPVEFDSDLLVEWVSDHPDDWKPLADAIKNGYAAHVAKREATVKN